MLYLSLRCYQSIVFRFQYKNRQPAPNQPQGENHINIVIPKNAQNASKPYQPVSVAVPRNTTIAWTNNDTALHTATGSPDPTDPQSGNRFDTSIIQVGATKQIDTANLEAGDYPYFCMVHPTMRGNLTVSD